MAGKHLHLERFRLRKINAQIVGDRLRDGVAREGKGADVETFTLHKEEVGRPGADIDHDDALVDFGIIVTERVVEREGGGYGALGREPGGVGRGAERLHRLELRRGEHHFEVEPVVGDDQVVPDDFVERIRDVFGRLERDDLAAFFFRHGRRLDKLRQRQMAGNGERTDAAELVAGGDGPEGLGDFRGPARLMRGVGAVRLDRELLQHQASRRSGCEHTARDMTCSNVNG